MPGSGISQVKRRYEVICPKYGEAGHYEKACKGPPKPGYVKKNKNLAKKTTTMENWSQTQPQSHSLSQESPRPQVVRPPPVRPPPPPSVRPSSLLVRPPPPPFIARPSIVGTSSIRPPTPPFCPPRLSQSPQIRPISSRFMPTPGFTQWWST
ncbi:formin-like protein 5 [Vicia villosa]|uniref:formin-like protein 5 n=1 Tax=Vicia villosa TaxID=3911 RepID=UPI00273CC040|nr:formin-like protein 5 [Vicia villosa]